MMLMALLIVLVMAAAFDTPVRRRTASLGAGLQRLLPRTTGGRIVLAIAALVVAVALFQVMKTEAAGVAAPMAPELATWFALLDVGTAMDLFAVALLATLTVRIKAVTHGVRTAGVWIVRLWRSGRQSRRRSARRPSRKTDNEGEPWGLATTFA